MSEQMQTNQPSCKVTLIPKQIDPITKNGPYVVMTTMKPADRLDNQYWTICHCCGTASVGKYRYDDLYDWREKPKVPVKFGDTNIIAYGHIEKGGLPKIGKGMGFLRLSDGDQDFMMTWVDPTREGT